MSRSFGVFGDLSGTFISVRSSTSGNLGCFPLTVYDPVLVRRPW